MDTRPGYTAGYWLGTKDLGRGVWSLVDDAEVRAVIIEKVQAAEARLDRPEPPQETRVVQMRRRREMSRRLPPQADGRRDPLGGPTDGQAC